MSWSFWISLSLSYLPIGSVGNTVNYASLSQPNKDIWQKRGQSASLPCTFSSNCSAVQPPVIQFQWFAFKENAHHHINLDTAFFKYSLEGASLHIQSLTARDSGIYYCAVVLHGRHASGAQLIGSGTTLVVQEEGKQMVGVTLMWLSFVLLAIYSLAVMILIVRKRNGHNIRTGTRICTTHKNNFTQHVHFHAVVQELYSKRHLKSSTQKATRDPSQNKAQSAPSSPSNDDIYQNL